jgi:ParB/RepB/Spo0J family partition protein
MPATIAPKNRTVKEPSIEQLAKEKARGPRPETRGTFSRGPQASGFSPSLAGELAAGMRKRAEEVADRNMDVLENDDYEFLRAVGRGKEMPVADVMRFQVLCERFPGTNPDGHKKNGQAAPGNHNGKSETKPAKPETPTAKRETGPIVVLQLKQLVRHPVNRHPSKESIDARAESMRERGQLEPIIVRPIDDWRMQVLSGETRWLAAEKIGRKEIDARICECDDAKALELVAEANGQRADLNDIERAELIERLCKPIADGGAGLTRDAAAIRVGLKDGSSASNLVRMLKLPKVWQQRVASGELPGSFARLLLPVLPLTPVMEHLEKAWKARTNNDHRYGNDTFESRTELERSIDAFTHNNCPRLDQEHYVGNYSQHRVKPKIDLADAELVKRLGIVEIELPEGKKGQLKKVAFATKSDEFRKLCEQQAQKAAKGKAAKAGAESKPTKKAPTPAELKAREKEQAEQLQRRIDAWRHDWLKSLVAAAVADNGPLRERLLIALAMGGIGDGRCDFDGLDAAVLQTAHLHLAGKKDQAKSHDAYEALVELDEDENGLAEVGTALVKCALLTEDRDPKYPEIEHEVMDELARFSAVDLAREWMALQDAQEDLRLSGDNDVASESRFACFFELFQSGQLDELGKELGVYVADKKAKDAKVRLLTTRDRTLKLPSCIKPLAAPGKAKGKKRK